VAQPSGSISRGFAEQRTAGGAIASAVREKLTGNDEDELLSARVPSHNGYLVATSLRLLWAGQRRTGSVGDIEAEFSYAEIASVHLTDGGGMSNKLLSIEFSDSSSVDVAIAKGQKPGRLVAAISSALS
jgi:hypothetical protein